MTGELKFSRHDNRAIALIVVLAFVVLLSAIVIAFLSRASSDRQLAHGSFNETRSDYIARSALDVITADLKQEIFIGSTPSTINGTVIYNPTSSSYLQPMRSGNPVGAPDPAPNLVRRSIRNDPIPPPGIASRASTVNSTTDTSRNGRFIGLARWNKHYLIPRIASASPTDTTPVANFNAPDWVLVSDQGPTVLAAPSNAVIGRYAFAIYDEGGLIDINVAGFPPTPNTTTAQSGPKGLLSFVDLTVLGMSTSSVNDLVGWRNYASSQPGGTFGSFAFTPVSGTTYYNSVLPSTNDFLKTSGITYNSRTDQKFINRQMLIQYRASGGINFSADAMQYLGTFSRELNMASWNNSQILRFPISKLSEVVPTGNAARIRADFGLIWNTDHWDYFGPTGGSLAGSIGAFVSASPEFFQLLNYALPGRTIKEILSTGASIIDQFDTDSTTTIIEYAGAAPPNPRAYGVELVAAPSPAPTPPAGAIVLNRALRSVGEFGYAYKDSPATQTLNFYTNGSPDAGALDLFSFTEATTRAGSVNLNTRNSLAIAAILAGAIETQPSSTITAARSKTAANAFITATSTSPATSRQDIPRLTASIAGSLGAGQERQELLSRTLADTCQTRTWNLMIDVIAQSGRYPQAATNLADFVVEGEKRYWLHVAIDRYTGQVIDQQLEAVYE